MADNRGENGKFLPGNPGGGRPKIAAEIRALFEAKSADAVAGLWKLYEDTDDDQVKAKVLTYWIDRVAGKPSQAITGEDGGPLQLQGMDLAALSEIQLAAVIALRDAFKASK